MKKEILNPFVIENIDNFEEFCLPHISLSEVTKGDLVVNRLLLFLVEELYVREEEYLEINVVGLMERFDNKTRIFIDKGIHKLQELNVLRLKNRGVYWVNPKYISFKDLRERYRIYLRDNCPHVYLKVIK